MSELPDSSGDFDAIAQLIRERRTHVARLINTEQIDLYWELAKTLSRKIEDSKWGKSTISALANFLKTEQPGLRGFSSQHQISGACDSFTKPIAASNLSPHWCENYRGPRSTRPQHP